MATFSVEIQDKDVDRVIEAICVNYNRPELIEDLPNIALIGEKIKQELGE